MKSSMTASASLLGGTLKREAEEDWQFSGSPIRNSDAGRDGDLDGK
jgi:hypothetical protein